MTSPAALSRDPKGDQAIEELCHQAAASIQLPGLRWPASFCDVGRRMVDRFPLRAFVAWETFLRRSHPILRMVCHLEDKSAMDNVFTVGEVVPYFGVYRITHYPPHTGEEALTLTKGSTFPQCVRCSHVSFMLINQLNQ